MSEEQEAYLVREFDESDLEELSSITNYDSFQILETLNQHPVAFRKWFVDLTGDLVAGLMLSQIHYWHGIADDGKQRLRVEKYGHLWLCKADNEWWDEIRITEKQARRARGILVELELIVSETHRFSGTPRTHIRINKPVFMQGLATAMQKSRLALQGELDLPPRANGLAPQGKYLTETTTETIPEITFAHSEAESASETDYTITYHYKDDQVSAIGRVKQGPWNVVCKDCGSSVKVEKGRGPVGCGCGMREYDVTLTKPQAIKRERKPEPVETYYSVYMGKVRYGKLDPIWEKEIAEVVRDLAFWKEILVAYVQPNVKGNPTNVANLLNHYRNQTLPGTRLTAGGTGGESDEHTESIAPDLKAV